MSTLYPGGERPYESTHLSQSRNPRLRNRAMSRGEARLPADSSSRRTPIIQLIDYLVIDKELYFCKSQPEKAQKRVSCKQLEAHERLCSLSASAPFKWRFLSVLWHHRRRRLKV